MFVGVTSQMVGSRHVSGKKLSSATISIQIVLGRTLLYGTISVTLMRGRPDKTVEPDERSSQLAGDLTSTYGVLGVQLVSRIVITSNDFCDCTSRKHVWAGE